MFRVALGIFIIIGYVEVFRGVVGRSVVDLAWLRSRDSNKANRQPFLIYSINYKIN